MRHLIVAAALAATLACAPAEAAGHNRALYRSHCVAAWCFVSAEPQRPAPEIRRARPKPRARRGAEYFHRLHRAHVRDRASTASPAGNIILQLPPTSAIAAARRYIGGNPTGRGRQWCGAFMRLVMRAAGQPDLHDGNLAARWARWGRPSSPAPGVLVIWSHHVGIITAILPDGRAAVISGNDGRRVRERVRSLAGAIAFRAG